LFIEASPPLEAQLQQSNKNITANVIQGVLKTNRPFFIFNLIRTLVIEYLIGNFITVSGIIILIIAEVSKWNLRLLQGFF
jgi:hypothetical protein